MAQIVRRLRLQPRRDGVSADLLKALREAQVELEKAADAFDAEPQRVLFWTGFAGLLSVREK